MTRKTLKYEEARLMGKIAGYNLRFAKRNNKQLLLPLMFLQ